MTKKATMRKAVQADSVRPSRRRVSKRLSGAAISPREDGVSLTFPAARGGSEAQALEALLSSVTDKLGDQGVEKAQMHEFLSLILDTDPALKEEILRGIRVSK